MEQKIIVVTEEDVVDIFKIWINGEEINGDKARFKYGRHATDADIAYAKQCAEYFFNLHNTLCSDSYKEINNTIS